MSSDIKIDDSIPGKLGLLQTLLSLLRKAKRHPKTSTFADVFNTNIRQEIVGLQSLLRDVSFSKNVVTLVFRRAWNPTEEEEKFFPVNESELVKGPWNIMEMIMSTTHGDIASKFNILGTYMLKLLKTFHEQKNMTITDNTVVGALDFAWTAAAKITRITLTESMSPFTVDNQDESYKSGQDIFHQYIAKTVGGERMEEVELYRFLDVVSKYEWSPEWPLSKWLEN
jgi:hypothetical protein